MTRTNYLLKIFLVLLAGISCSASAQTTTFGYTGAVQTYTVPAGVTCLNIDAQGATGGQNSDASGGSPWVIDSGGHGARVQATLTVIPGEILNIFVGGQGAVGVLFTAAPGGYNGGGASDFDPASLGIPGNAGGGGGGATDIRVGGISLANRVLVAGGGGGAGAYYGYYSVTWPGPGFENLDKGGDGGGTTGQDGSENAVIGGPHAGLGGTPLAGGAGGLAMSTYGAGGAGISGVGGDAGAGSAGGGGGGGYFGGGGSDYSGGGGGSSYTDPGVTVSVTHTRGYNATGNGVVYITPLTAGTITGPATICMGSTATYTDPTAGGTILWSASPAGVITIGAGSGIATTVAPGTATITASVTTPCGVFTTTYSVTVNAVPSAITGNAPVCVGDSVGLADVTPGGTWSSVTPAVGTIDAAGFVAGRSVGTTVISYTVAGCSATTIVTVNPVPGPITGSLTVCVGITNTLSNTLGGGTWTSVSPATGTIGAATGIIGGISAGTTTINYSVAGCAVSAVATVNPSPAPITGNGAICAGDSVALADITPGGVWSSVTPAVGTISGTGVVRGLSGGTTVISYTVAGCPATVIATINAVPSPISGPLTICVGTSSALTDLLGGGTWVSMSPAVGTIGAATGLAGGISAGTTVISYTVAGCSTSAVVTVNTAPTAIAGPSIVCAGSSITLTDPVTGGTWSSLSPAIGTIDAFGTFRGLSAGTSTVRYTIGSCFVSQNITVTAPLPAIGGPDSICLGTTVTFTNTTGGGVWSSSDPTVISILPGTGDATGIIPFLGATISYTVGGCATSRYIAVSDSARPVTGANSVCQGSSVSLAEGSIGGRWSITPAGIATISVSGFFGTITGVGSGVITVSYSMPFCPVKTHVVTVNPLPQRITGVTAVCVGLGTALHDSTAGGFWSSSNPAVTVSPTGIVTSSVTGIIDTIYYSLPTGCTVQTVVNVGTPPSRITPSHPSRCVGDTVTLSISDTGGIWSSTNLAIAPVIDSSGLVRGMSAGSVIISYTLRNGCFSTDSVTINPLIPASVVISGPAGSVCAHDTVTLYAHATNGGTPTYYWQLFSGYSPLHVADSTSDSLKYVPTHGDVLMVHMVTHNICSVQDSVIDTFAINVYPDSVSALVTIVTSSPDSITYMGQIITFYSSVTWGGTAPAYQWYVNRRLVPGATSSSFATAVYGDDTVHCEVIGNSPCHTIPLFPGISNFIVIHANYLGVSTLSNTGELSLFPNPNTGSFTLSGAVSNTGGREVTYEVSNILGQVVYRGAAMPQNGRIDQQIAISNIPSGAYLLRVNTDAGSQSFHFTVSK